VQHYRGEDRDVLDRRTRQWFLRDVVPRVRPRALEEIEEHRRKGHPLVLLTNSSCFEAAVAAETWAFDDWLANTFHVDDAGRLLGTYESPMCYGMGKVIRAERWAEEHGVDLEVSSFYSDSLSDLPMLERVGDPRVVCPDPRLRRIARKRGWPILDW
jgi:HAD superfamily hydrolase (TIGR01490 family)